jgi:hypothetical protein
MMHASRDFSIGNILLMLTVKSALTYSSSDFLFDDETITAINDIKLLESNIIYFSAGESRIKEILVKRDPSYSV